MLPLWLIGAWASYAALRRRTRGATRVGSVRPQLGTMPLAEAQDALYGHMLRDVRQLREGAQGVSEALLSGRLRYIRSDPLEQWLTIREVWKAGGGDCEDLACAIAAEWVHKHDAEARPILYQAAPGLAHCIAEVYRPPSGWPDGQRKAVRRFDPSVTGGMHG